MSGCTPSKLASKNSDNVQNPSDSYNRSGEDEGISGYPPSKMVSGIRDNQQQDDNDTYGGSNGAGGMFGAAASKLGVGNRDDQPNPEDDPGDPGYDQGMSGNAVSKLRTNSGDNSQQNPSDDSDDPSGYGAMSGNAGSRLGMRGRDEAQRGMSDDTDENSGYGSAARQVSGSRNYSSSGATSGSYDSRNTGGSYTTGRSRRDTSDYDSYIGDDSGEYVSRVNSGYSAGDGDSYEQNRGIYDYLSRSGESRVASRQPKWCV